MSTELPNLKPYSFSPVVRIHLEIANQVIRLADVLDTSAIVFDPLELSRDTPATLVISIDEAETRQEVMVNAGVFEAFQPISLSYVSEHFHAEN